MCCCWPAQAAHAGPDVAASCAARHATLLFRQRDWPAAVAVLAEHGVSSSPGNFELYREVVLEVLAANMQQRQQAAEEHARWAAEGLFGRACGCRCRHRRCMVAGF